MFFLITECIGRGVNSGAQIVEAIAQAGFNKRYVGILRSGGVGTDPVSHWWTKDAEGRYQMLD